MENRWIYHLSRQIDWLSSETANTYSGSKEDRIDGYLHFSTAKQVIESAKKHRKGELDLLLLEVDTKKLHNSDLRWEPARRGELFPHLYGALNKDAIARVIKLPLDEEGKHIFPNLNEESS